MTPQFEDWCFSGLVSANLVKSRIIIKNNVHKGMYIVKLYFLFLVIYK